MNQAPAILPTQLEWQNGQPISKHYGDVYFSRDSGLDESRHVFLAHNHLQQRWQTLNCPHFTIVETGFGTGLNFLCAWQLWQACAPFTSTLHFISTEKHPLSHADLDAALQLWPQLAEQRLALLAQYRYLSPGWHRLSFAGGKVSLTLLIGDAGDTLPQLKASVDAWFLDGFAPAKNPDMWQQAVFDTMAGLSHSATTFATFTSAGAVRRGLQAAGFSVSKAAGFGRKREMLCGHYIGRSPTANVSAIASSQTASSQRAIVIGGGIAGTSTAHVLATRGWHVSLIERHAALAQEASGNSVAVLYPRLAGTDIALSRLALHGYLHTLRLLEDLNLDVADYSACGLLQLAYDAKELIKCKAVAARGLPAELVHYVAANQASVLAGSPLAHDGLYFPSAGWVNPQSFCAALARHENISVILSSNALKLRKEAGLWQVWSASQLLNQAPVLIIASANDSAGFDQTKHLPLEPVRGQVSMVAASAASRRLKTVVCTDGYISPAAGGMHCLGATFSANDVSTEIRDSDHMANFAMLKRMSPELHASLSQSSHAGRAALRCATPDYLPLAGLLLDSSQLLASPPRHTVDPASLPWLAGLYLNTGHGSKGLINAPLCAEMIACAVNGEPAPVDAKLLAALDPNRFLLRKIGLKRLVQGLAVYPLL